jgi:hypothetical protein
VKYLIAFVLILSVLSFQFSELLIYLSFKINQDYIAKNLCVEKDVEGSTCAGCCQLKKKLEQQEQKKEALPPIQSDKMDITFYSILSIVLPGYYPKLTILALSNSDKYTFLLNYGIFHPPRTRLKIG